MQQTKLIFEINNFFQSKKPWNWFSFLRRISWESYTRYFLLISSLINWNIYDDLFSYKITWWSQKNPIGRRETYHKFNCNQFERKWKMLKQLNQFCLDIYFYKVVWEKSRTILCLILMVEYKKIEWERDREIELMELEMVQIN